MLLRQCRHEFANPGMTPVAEYLVRRTLIQNCAVIHEHDPVRGRARELQLVAHNDHGHAGVAEGTHHLEDAVDQLGIERAGRLVEQHDLRLQRQRPRDGDALLLTAGELARISGGLVREPDPGECGPAALLRFTAREPLHLS